MSRLRLRQIGSDQARCRRCGACATLTVTELRDVRRWSQILDPSFDAGMVRSATCSVCVTTYAIRTTDRTAEPASRRRDTVDEPRGRDWAYPPEQRVPAGRR